jgi:hypothetical protein
MTSHNVHPKPFYWVFPSLAIAFILGFQFYSAQHLRDFWPKSRILQPLLKLLNPKSTKELWPFIDYPMYSYPKELGDNIQQYSVYGVLDNGTEVKIEPENLGVNYWIFMYGIVTSLRKEDVEDVKHFVEMFEQRNQVKLQSIRLENQPLTLTESGVQPSDTEVLTEIALSGVQ